MGKIDLELVFDSKDVYKILEIADSTLREWCLALEAGGYAFKMKNVAKDGTRLFYKNDIETLTMLKKILNFGITMEIAVTLIIRMGFLFVPHVAFGSTKRQQ